MAESEQQLDQHEGRDARRRVSPRAAVVFEAIREEGESELARKSMALFWSGLAAGLSMGFSFVAETLLSYHLPANADWTQLITKLGYSVGFLIVVLGRQQLFTEITLTATLPVLARPKWIGVKALARLWSVVFVANMVGTAVYGAGIAFDVLDTPDITAAALAISREAMEAGPWSTLLRGIVAGWLIATAWPSASRSSRTIDRAAVASSKLSLTACPSAIRRALMP